MRYVEVRSRELPSVFDYMAQDVAVATDGAGQKLTYVHFEDEPGRQSAAKLLTSNEARRIAAAMLIAGIETDSRCENLEIIPIGRTPVLVGWIARISSGDVIACKGIEKSARRRKRGRETLRY